MFFTLINKQRPKDIYPFNKKIEAKKSFQKRLLKFINDNGFSTYDDCQFMDFVFHTKEIILNMRFFLNIEFVKFMGLDISRKIHTKSYLYTRGTPEICEFLFENGTHFNISDFYGVIEGGNLSLAKFFYENNICDNDPLSLLKKDLINKNLLFKKAIRSEKIEMIEWAYDTFEPFLNEEIFGVAGSTTLEIVKFLYKEGCPYNKSVYRNAVRKGDTEVLEWLDENNFPKDAKQKNYLLCGSVNCRFCQ